MNLDSIPLEIVDWCRNAVGNFTVVSSHDTAHGDSEVWRLQAEDRFVYLKLHDRRAKWVMEVHAYENWVSILGNRAPRAIAVCEEPLLAILLSEIPGITMDKATLSPERELAAWQEAGSTLAQFHQLPSGTYFGIPFASQSNTDPVALTRSSLDRWLARGMKAGSLTPAEVAIIQQTSDLAEVFAGELPAPCHGDYQPRNWIVDSDGTWKGVIDFEHARWDLKMNDIGYWWDRGLHSRPDLQQAFLQGYGGLSDRQQQQLHFIRVLGATGRIVWGSEYRDESTANLGRQVLKEVADLI